MDKGAESFDAEIRNLITTTLNETNYRPSLFMQMVSDRGAMDACLSLVRAPKPSDGFTRLWELQRLDLTVEAVVILKKYSDLFLVEDVERSKKRLSDYGYSQNGST